jgi:hypothetical protein
VALNNVLRSGTGYDDGRIIGLVALLLVAVAVIWARRVREPPAPGVSAPPGTGTAQRARRALIAGLLVVPALTGGAALIAANYAETHVSTRHFITQLALAPDGDRLYYVSEALLPGQRFPRPDQLGPAL